VVKIDQGWRARFRRSGETVYGQWHETPEAAERDRRRMLAAFQAGADPDDGAVHTVREWAHRCLLGRWGRSLSKDSFETAEGCRHRFINDSQLGRTRVDLVTSRLVQEWVDGLRLADGAVPSPRYVRRQFAVVAKMFSLAVREGIVQSNPCSGTELPKVIERENRTLAPEEALLLLNPTDWVGTAVLVAVLCGLRRGEIVRMRWDDVDRRHGVLRVRGTKTDRARRTVPLPAEVLAALDRLPRLNEHVFVGPSGAPVRADSLSRAVAKRKADLGLPAETRLQDLRGSYVSLLIEQGAEIREVMDLAGHGDPRTTLKAYARSRHVRRQAAVGRVVSAIRAATGLDDRVRDESGGEGQEGVV
jgi:integrase